VRYSKRTGSVSERVTRAPALPTTLRNPEHFRQEMPEAELHLRIGGDFRAISTLGTLAGESRRLAWSCLARPVGI